MFGIFAHSVVHKTRKYFFFQKINFKIRFHFTIYTFKNYFTTILLISSNK